MHKRFILAGLATTVVVACSLYFADDPTQSAPDGQRSGVTDGDRSGGYGTDASVPGDAQPADADGFPDGQPADPDAGTY
jgi:hypothetical protein